MVQELERRQGGGGITFFVDDEPQTTDQEELKVREILEMAGARLEETDEPLLRELRGENEVEHRDPDETVRVEDDLRFYTTGAHVEEIREGEDTGVESPPTSEAPSPTPGGGAQRGEAIEESKDENARKRRGPEPGD